MRRLHWYGLVLCVVWVSLSAAQAATPSSRYDAANTGSVANAVSLPPTLLWKHSTELTTDPIIASPCVGEQMVYVALGKKVIGLDRLTGDVKWQFDTGTKLFSTPVFHEGRLYLGGQDSNLWVFNAHTGQPEWKFKLAGPVDCPPLIVGSMLYIGSDDDSLHAIDLTRQGQVWAFGTDGDIKCAPAFGRGNLYFASRDEYLYCIGATDRQLKWRSKLNSGDNFSAPVVDTDRGLVFVTSGTALQCFDAETHNPRWAPFYASDLISGSPALADDRKLYVGSKDGAVYCISALDGRPLWKYPEGTEKGIEPILSSPTVLPDDTLLVRTGPKLLACLNRQTGALKWEYRMATPPEKPKTGTAGQGLQGGPGMMGPGGGMMPGAGGGMMPGGGGMMPGAGGGMMPGAGAGAGAGGGAGAAGGMAPGAGGRTTRGGRTTGRTGRAGGGLGGAGGGVGAGLGQAGGAYEEEKPAEFTESLEASPVVAEDGAVYVLGNEGAVYGFDPQSVDLEPPLFSNAVLDITGKDKYRFLYGLVILGPDASPKRYADALSVPGLPPIRLTLDVMDEGSGVNPTSVEMYMDDTKLVTIYDPVGSQVLYIMDPEHGAARPLPNGPRNFVVKARDWQGNLGVAQVAFTVDNALPPPEAKTAGGMMPGGGGMMGPGAGMMGPGGGMMPGGMMPGGGGMMPQPPP